MGYQYNQKQQAVNTARVYVENNVIGAEFIRLIDELGYEEAVRVLQRLSNLARTLDYDV